ncbi:MAG: hypothetical protein ACXIU7_13720, partial [Roseinatronobacter sp.]
NKTSALSHGADPLPCLEILASDQQSTHVNHPPQLPTTSPPPVKRYLDTTQPTRKPKIIPKLRKVTRADDDRRGQVSRQAETTGERRSGAAGSGEIRHES